MFQRATVFFCLSLVLVSAGFAQKASPEGELRAIYKKLDVALRARDAAKVTQYYDASYTLESDGKTMDRAEAVDQWRSILGYIRSVAKLITTIDKITIKDGAYVVDYSQSSSGKIQFPQSPVLPFTFTGKITDTWRRDKNGLWHTMSSVEHVSDLKVNGESSKPPGT